MQYARALHHGCSTAHHKRLGFVFLSGTPRLKMNVDDSRVGVPTTTLEAMEKELGQDHPIESSETHTPAGAEAPAALEVIASTLVGPSLLSIPQNLTSWS